ncbi:unnamed protein product [Lepeophtheirus salmonis]|uniref:(salmon louse) hypothetical protein n=1 Tax=Lepeophtheirus salmonis TaxID=72036 RepID=A0A7R8CEI2_LEPSM|nr:unnamed protein product [Lepeophtheirus salmonis]CAF2795740.1 unnamed protein product [Lepeophtheirus salmonis]
MDEMSIKSDLEYDVGDPVVRGYDTIQYSSDELASHVFCVCLSRSEEIRVYQRNGYYTNEEANWRPSTHSRLYSKHIERSQFKKLDHSKQIKKLSFGAIPTLFSHVKPSVQRETVNSRKSDEEREELGNMKLGSCDNTYDDHPHLEESAADNNTSAVHPLECSPMEDIMEFYLGTRSDESFQAHSEEYIHIKKYQKLLQKLKKVKDMSYSLQIQLDVQKDKIVELKKKNYQRETKINLLSKTSKVRVWSDKTIKKSLQLRLARTTSDYQILISHGHSLPINQTLQDQTMEDSNKYCVIVMDDMSIKPTLEYDVGDQLIRGYDTLTPSSDELAPRALVFALVGVKARWKQVVAYHFTESSFNKKMSAWL